MCDNKKSVTRKNMKTTKNETSRRNKFILKSENQKAVKRKNMNDNKIETNSNKHQRYASMKPLRKEILYNMQTYFENERLKVKILYYNLWHLLQGEMVKGTEQIPVPTKWLERIVDHLRNTSKVAEGVVAARDVKKSTAKAKGTNLQTSQRKPRGKNIFALEKRPITLSVQKDLQSTIKKEYKVKQKQSSGREKVNVYETEIKPKFALENEEEEYLKCLENNIMKFNTLKKMFIQHWMDTDERNASGNEIIAN